MEALDGLLLVDKPCGPTSHDVVARVRTTTGQRRLGHAGTLDPPASGLLPLVLGRATRLVRFLPHSPKTYTGALRLGLTTTTDDITGEPLGHHDGRLPEFERVLAAAAGFRGESLQRPPAISARKVGGQRLYRLARRGVHVEAEPRPIEVSRFDVQPTEAAEDWRFVTEVSAGTYVRALVRDLGESLGCGATLLELRRTAIGPLRVELAVDPEAPAETLRRAVVPLERLPLWPPQLRLRTPEQARGFRSGVALSVAATDTGVVAVTDPDGRLLGIGESSGSRLRPRVVLA